MTSSLPFAQRTKVLGDAALTTVLLDRLTQRGFIHDFSWERARLTESLQRMKKVPQEAANRAGAAPAVPAGAKKERTQEEGPNPS